VIKIELEKLLKGRSLYWLSQATGIRWATISAMARSKLRRIDLEALNAICEALECEPGDLLVLVETRKRLTRKDRTKP